MSIDKSGIQLDIKGLGKRFGEATVLEELHLSIAPGDFVVIVGRSGCGKSTLLRLIAGLDSATEGSIYLDGEKTDGISQDTRFLFQEARLLPWKRVLKNIQLGAVDQDSGRALKALAQVGLGSRGGDWPHVLSGGQKQRVALARALAAGPRLLLLDEPLGALDALTRIEMQQLIEHLWLKQKFTAILVTHDVSEAVMLANRVLFIDNGNIALDIRITLDRPRQKNNDFIYFEKQILDKVLDCREARKVCANEREYAYSI